MTVYTGVLSQIKQKSRTIAKEPLKEDRVRGTIKISQDKLNIFLIGLIASLVLIYVFLANFLVFQKYNLSLHKGEIDQVNSKLAAMDVNRETQSLSELLNFAQKNGLVEAKDTGAMLDNDGFAFHESR